MQEYPYFSPQILNDNVFLTYGGVTGTASQAVRNVAYLLAEEQMTSHLGAFLKPTIATGTYFWTFNPLELDYGRVQRIIQVNTVSVDAAIQETIVTGTSYLLRNAEYGYLDVYPNVPYRMLTLPYQIQVVYESGFSTGTSTQPTLLIALTLAAQINLNELDPALANEGIAGIGIQQFSNQSYSEMRVKLGNTNFGTSPQAQRVAQLVRKYRSKPAVSFHK